MTSTTVPPQQQARPSAGFLILACALTTFPPVTGDLYLPALPQLTHDLGGTTAQGQYTLAGYFVGLGLGQAFYGPMADRVGRKPVILFGALLYLVATIGCFLATSIEQMIGLRFVQALGACSGLVVSAAMVRDRFGYQESARILSMLLTARSLGPLLAPIAGGVLVTLFGWRGVFGALGLFGMSILLAVVFGMTETRPQEVADRARSESPFGAYGGVISNRRIMGYVLTNGCNYGSLFAWIAVAPFLIIEVYEVAELWFGWIFGALALGITVAAQVNRRLLQRHSANQVMMWGAALSGAAAGVLLADALTGFGGVLGIMLPLFLVVCSVGFVSTNAMAGALSVDPSRSGSVAAVVGASQFLCAALVAWLASFVAADPSVALAIVIFGCAVGAGIYPLSLYRAKRGESEREEAEGVPGHELPASQSKP